MASTNLDLVRSIYADWERGDFRSTEWADHQIEFGFGDGLEASSSTGLAAMAARWREFLGNWDEFRTWTDGYRELDDGRVLVLMRLSGRGRTSGLEVEQTGMTIFQFAHGKVTGLLFYNDRDHGFADLGLEG